MAKRSHPLPTPSPSFETQRPGWIMQAAWPCNIKDFSEALESCRADPAALLGPGLPTVPPPPNPNLELYQQNKLRKGGVSASFPSPLPDTFRCNLSLVATASVSVMGSTHSI